MWYAKRRSCVSQWQRLRKTVAFGRPAAPEEVEAAARFIGAQTHEGQGDSLADFCHALINANEFTYVD
ncbi:MAG TPA: hypothetical protein PK867_19880 [Pirellulales bacterium]|nr:hypothetical protein [Pirellulales bacterium]